LAALKPEIENGTPIIGLEPACVSAFRDELPGLFPGHEAAQRLAGQTQFISEFLARRCGDAVPRVSGQALVHLHCHHHAIIKPDAERALLDRMGVDYELLASGCCGMAGAFGFERGDKYDVSIKAGERVLLPAVRAAPTDALIVADGFSCREQIEQTTNRRALHLAQVITLARQGAPTNGHPEDACPPPRAPNHLPYVLAGVGALVGGALAWQRARRN
jgi:Fe-S oxidoreductase